MLAVTEKAQQQAEQLRESTEDSKDGLRVAVMGGGCSGLQYKLGWDEAKEDDVIQEYPNGVKILVDPKSAPLLVGSTLEFHDELNRSGFEVVNPNSCGTCGCGKSFCV